MRSPIFCHHHPSLFIWLTITYISELDFKYTNDPMQTEILDLKNCCIEIIHPGAFRNFSYLEALYLDNNALAEVNFEDFVPLKALKILSLASNEIIIVQHYTHEFILPNLHVLFLNENEIQELHHDMQQFLFRHRLISLKLGGNPWICENKTCKGIEWIAWIDQIRMILTDLSAMTCVVENQIVEIEKDLLSSDKGIKV